MSAPSADGAPRAEFDSHMHDLLVQGRDTQAAHLAGVGYTHRRRMLLGDGTGAVPLPGRVGWAYVHTRDAAGNVRARTWALNPRALSTHGQPVWVGFMPRLKALVIYDLDVETIAAFYASSAQPIPAVVSAHGPTHELFGGDAVIVSNRQMRELSVHPTHPASMAVHVFPGLYWDGDTLRWYAGGDSADLTSYAPGTAGQARWCLVSLDRAAGTLSYTAGDPFAAGASPYADWSQAADLVCPDGDKPLAVVYLINGQEAVDWQHLQRPDWDGGSAGGGGGATVLDDLEDVSVEPEPGAGDVLAYTGAIWGNNSLAALGALMAQGPVIHVTDDVNLSAQDSGTLLWTEDVHTVYLPPAAAGLWFWCVDLVGAMLEVQAQGGDFVIFPGYFDSAIGAIADVNPCTGLFFAIDAAHWVILAALGEWGAIYP